jgi:dTDP-L-rhamnose 4-epimerase
MKTSLGRVLVTGGAGFIGCAVSQVLAPLAQRYCVVDALHPQVHPSGKRPSALSLAAELVVSDIAVRDTWEDLLDQFQPDVVLHLAAETGTAQSLSESARHARVNVLGTAEMLDSFGRHGIRPERLVLVSSRAVYGEGEWRRTDGTSYYPGQRSHRQLLTGNWEFADSSPVLSTALSTWPLPTSVYGATKLAQEHVSGAWCRSYDIGITTLRLQNVYGPGQSLNNPYTGIVTLFSRLAATGASIPVYEDGKITRDFVYIDDVVSAIVEAMTASRVNGLVLDVGSGAGCTVLALAQMIAETYGAPPPRITGQFREGDVRFAACDIEPTRRALGWVPRWRLSDGLAQVRAWMESTGDV